MKTEKQVFSDSKYIILFDGLNQCLIPTNNDSILLKSGTLKQCFDFMEHLKQQKETKMTFEDLYYKLEKVYIDPFRKDIETNNDFLTCFDAWHNMRHLSVKESFLVLDDLDNSFKWLDDATDYIDICTDDFINYIKESIESGL